VDDEVQIKSARDRRGEAMFAACAECATISELTRIFTSLPLLQRSELRGLNELAIYSYFPMFHIA
jgi:hypothetical protein